MIQPDLRDGGSDPADAGPAGEPVTDPDELVPGLVSVVLPVHDRGDLVGEAIASVLSQTHQDLELIVVDDGSTDDSVRRAREAADHRTRIIELADRLGVCAARNAGIDAARGQYLAFQDSDDLWDREKIARQIHHLTEHQARVPQPVGAVCCRGRVAGTDIVEGGWFGHGPFTRTDVLTGSLRERTPMLLLDRAVIDRSARFDPSFPAIVERDFVISALADEATLSMMSDILVTIRRGRHDHVAVPERALTSFQRYLDKYAAEMVERPDIASWYAFQAMREALRIRRVREAATFWPAARFHTGWRTVPHALAGVAGGRRGMAAANRILPVRPPKPRGVRRGA